MEYAKLTGSETVWDLYCGIGSISLFLAKNARKVIGVEIVEPAVEDAKVNARINNIENVDFISGAAEDVVPEYFQKHKDAPECNAGCNSCETHREKAVMRSCLIPWF